MTSLEATKFKILFFVTSEIPCGTHCQFSWEFFYVKNTNGKNVVVSEKMKFQ